MADVLRRIVDAIDRVNYRILYVVLAVLLALPSIVGHWETKPIPRRITRGLFDAIEECANTGKPVLLLNAWIMDSRGENQPQFEVLVDHMMRRHVKFIMLSLDPGIALVGRDLCQKAEKYCKAKYGDDFIQYGRDWLMLGYKPVYTAGWPAWIKDIKTKGLVGTFKTDYSGRDLDTYPIMKRPGAASGEEQPPAELQPDEETESGTTGDSGAESAQPSETPEGESGSTATEDGEAAAPESGGTETEEGKAEEGKEQWLELGDFGLIVEVHFVQSIKELIGLVRLSKDFAGPDGKPKIMMGLGTVNMVVNEMLSYFDTGDLSGILAGVQGAVEYSELLQDTYGEGPSREGVKQRANPYSMGVLFVLFLIVVGNLCTLWKKLDERRQARAGDE